MKPYILPDEEICQRYILGETEYSLAQAFGVSRQCIKLRLKKSGIQRRTPSEARRLTVQSSTPEQRSAQAKAAHDAVRGMTRSFEQKCKNAQTRQEKQLGVSPAEQLLQRWLVDRGIDSTAQYALGPYNIDLAFDHIAVEVYGGGWHGNGRHLARAAERRYYIASQGWSLIIIWLDTRKWPLSPACADYIVAFSQQHHTPTTKVIHGKGKEFPVGSAYYNKALGIQ